jgi:hypothetical protein
MAYSITLVDIAGAVIAVACVQSTLTDVRGAPCKLWRLGLPPLLGSFASILILARAVVSFEHDAIWMVTALCGVLVGWWRGRQIVIETDQIWGVVRTRRVVDSLVAALLILLIVLVDGIKELFPTGTLPRHAQFAAGSALCAGYLAGRAWSLIGRAVRAPHVELQKH